MNKDTNKTKEQLFAELTALRKKSKEQLFSSIFNTLRDVLFLIDVESESKFRFKYINKAFLDATGLSRSDIEGKLIEEVIPEPSIHIVKENYLKSIKEKKIIKWEETSEYPAGVKIGIVSIVPVFDEKGNCRQLVGSVHDITERKQAEEALKEREEKISSLFNGIPLPVFVHPLKSEGFAHFIEVNDSACEQYGYSREEFLKLSPTNISSPEDAHQKGSVEGRRRLKEEGQAIFEATHITKYGKRFPVEISSTIFNLAGQKVILSVAIDITERNRAKEALASSEERLRILFESAPDAYYIIDLKGNFIDGNKTAENMLGYNREELIGKNFTKLNLLSSKELPKALAGLAMNVLGKSTGPDEYTLLRKDGVLVPVEIRTHPVKIAGKRVVLGIARDITERKQAEKKIIQQNEFLNNVLESLTYPFYLIDINDYSILRANSASGLNSGLNKITCHALTHNSTVPCNSQDHPCPLEIVKKTRKPTMVEHIHIDADGNRRNVEVYCYPVFDKNGDLISAIEYSLDITERRQAEKKLKESEERFRIVFNNANDLMYIVEVTKDKGPVVVDANNSVFELLGYTRDELIGMPMSALDGEESKEKIPERVKRIMSGRKFTFESLQLRKDGSVFPVEVSASLIKIAGKTYIHSVNRDITERKSAEKELTKLSTAVTQSPSVIAITDTDGNIKYVNPKFTEITGYSLEEAIGQNPRILKSGEQPYEMYEELWETISSGKTWRGEFHNKKKNGELYWESASISPIFDAEGNIINYIKVAEDITEQKLMTEALIENETKFRTLFDRVEDAVFIYDPETFELIEANEATAKIYGYQMDELIGMSVLKFSAEVEKSKGNSLGIVREDPDSHFLEAIGRVVGV